MTRLLIAAALTLALSACGQGQITPTATAPDEPFDSTHARLDALLREHVRDGLVDYGALVENRSALDTYLASAAAVTRSTFDGWSADEQLAFLINVYNAYTLQLVAEHWPVDSVKDTHALRNPWDHFVFPLLGEEVTLNQIEHERIRPVYGDARIHFALVCAAHSCPPLLSRAFRAEDLDAVLDANTRAFLASEHSSLADPGRLRLSRLFDWYADDFAEQSGSVVQFIAEHTDSEVSPSAAVDFLDYDWTINAQR